MSKSKSDSKSSSSGSSAPSSKTTCVPTGGSDSIGVTCSKPVSSTTTVSGTVTTSTSGGVSAGVGIKIKFNYCKLEYDNPVVSQPDTFNYLVNKTGNLDKAFDAIERVDDEILLSGNLEYIDSALLSLGYQV